MTTRYCAWTSLQRSMCTSSRATIHHPDSGSRHSRRQHRRLPTRYSPRRARAFGSCRSAGPASASRHGTSIRSLAPEARVRRRSLEVGTKRVDVDAAAALVAGVDRQLLGAAALPESRATESFAHRSRSSSPGCTASKLSTALCMAAQIRARMASPLGSKQLKQQKEISWSLEIWATAA